MKKYAKIILLFSIAANAVLFVALATGYVSLKKSPAVADDTRAGSAGGGAFSPEAARATEALLSMDDLAALRDKLRALGLPEDVVKEIVKARIASRYTASLRDIGNAALEAARQRPYWQRDRNYVGGWVGYSDEQNQKMRDIMGEKESEMTRLFGADKTDRRASSDAYLSPEKAARLAELERDYWNMRSQVLREKAGFLMPGDAEKIRLLDAEKKRDTLALLTPEEKQARDLHESWTARGLQSLFAGFDGGTEEEYKAIFALRYPLEEKYPPEWESYAAAMGSDSPEDYYKARDADAKKVEEQIKALLGPERYQDYLRAKNTDYTTLLAAAERFNLSAETVAQTYQARTDAAREAERISGDTSLSAEERSAAFAALSEQALAQIRATLGEEVGNAYIDKTCQWLKDLPKSGRAWIGPMGYVNVAPAKGAQK